MNKLENETYEELTKPEIDNELYENKTMFTINKDNISNYLSVDNIDIEKELELISPTLLRTAVTANKNGIYVANDKVVFKMSKKGNLYCMIKKRYVSGKLLNRAIYTALFSVSEPIEEVVMGSMSLIKARTPKGAELWFLKGKEVYSIKSDASAKQTLQNFYYNKMKEEMDRIESKVFEPTSAEDNIYEVTEDFQDRTNELEEALQVVLSMRDRNLLPEEREVLKELLSEINALI